jgi:hypothetical protein
LAFYNNEEDENELDPNNQGLAQTSPGSGVIAGQGSVASPQTADKTPAPDKPGNFVGISQYLNANKPQAAKLGDQTAGVINQSADQARQGIATLNQEADQKIKPISALDQGLVQKINTGAETLSADERNLAKQTASAKYTGPKQISDFGDTYTNASKATQAAANNINNSGTEQGRMNLISQVNSKPRTQGMNVFDNTLLQAGGGREKIANAASANQNLTGEFQGATENIQNKIGRADDPSTPDIDESSGAIGQTAKSQTDAYKTIQDALTGWKSGFTPKVSQAQQALIDQQNKITQDLGDNQFDLQGEALEALGLGRGQKIYDLDLKSYLNTVSPTEITAANTATAEDYARYAALADLAGEQDLLLKPEDISKSGTAPKPGANKEKLTEDLAKKEAAYNSAFNSSRDVLDLGLLPGGSAGASYSGSIPGALTERRDLDRATPAELESLTKQRGSIAEVMRPWEMQ